MDKKRNSLTFESALTLLNKQTKIEIETKETNKDFHEEINQKKYKANSIKQAIDAIDRYLRIHSPISHINLHDKHMFPDLINVLHGRMKDLQERGLGEVTSSLALNTEQMQHSKMNLRIYYTELKTAAQCLQDNNISEQAIMQLTGHKSVEGVRAYKKINEEQKSYTMNTLINITDNSKNNSEHPLQEISFNSLNNNSQTPIFNNCTFSN
ncbi:4383_t:CDS:2, partial [Diversispora eburnea]